MKAECETKHKLLETALKLIWESSYGAVSVDDICKAAGVKKGSFYYFFPSKADLVVEAIENDWQLQRKLLDDVYSPSFPVRERIARIARHVIETQKAKKATFGKVCGCPNFTIGSELSTQEEKIRIKVKELMERKLRYYEVLVRDAVAEGLIKEAGSASLANEMFSFVLGLVMQAKVTNSLQPLQSVESGLLRLLGLSVQTQAA